MSQYEVHQRKNGLYYFILKAPNGTVLVYSSDYASEAACYNGIASVRANAFTETVIDETKQ